MTTAPARAARPLQVLWLLLPLAAAGAVAAALTVLALVGGVNALAATVRVQLVIDGAASLHDTRALTVADLLREAGIAFTSFDRVQPAPEASLAQGMVVQVARARRVQVVVDGAATMAQTAAANPAAVLDALGVALTAGDLVLVDGARVALPALAVWPGAAARIEVRHQRALTVEDGESRLALVSTAATVGDALFEAGVPLFVSDGVEPPLHAPLPASGRITIQRALPVTIQADGATRTTRAPAGTVADVLSFAGMTLMGQDYTVPAEDTPVTAGMTIRIVRVTETLLSESAPLPFETLIQADATRPIDTRGLAQEGREGVQRTVTRVRLEDGVEVARTLAETSVVVPPQDRIITYGTEVVLNTLDTPDGPQVYWRVLRLYATSYHPAALGGDNVTATGRLLEKGIVGADTDLLPFGTQVYVPGYGVGLVADTGAERHDPYWIDLGYSDADWRSWSRPVEVYLLAPPPRQIDYMAGNLGE
jgi:uncharacterized protein YabE (DUF348 family)/3D (Asp-Asp-Asp) domain-containing protein